MERSIHFRHLLPLLLLIGWFLIPAIGTLFGASEDSAFQSWLSVSYFVLPVLLLYSIWETFVGTAKMPIKVCNMLVIVPVLVVLSLFYGHFFSRR